MNQEELKFLLEPTYLWSIGVAVGVLFLLWLLMRRGGNKGRVRKVMKSVSHDMMTDIILPDGVGGLVEVEYLLLLSTGVMVVDVKDYKGVLFGADNADAWSQVLGVKSYKFKNPIPQLNARAQAIKSHFPNTKVSGRVVFTNEGRFPKGIPSNVSMLDAFKSELGPAKGAAPVAADVQAEWTKFQETIANSAFNAR